MSETQPRTCFISYTHEGVDRLSVDQFIRELRDLSKGKIDFLYDEDLPPGRSIAAHMDRTADTDAILILLTPQYKKRIDSRAGSVYEEFRSIVRRARSRDGVDEAGEPVSARPALVIPVVFAGSFAEACPEELKDKKSIDLSGFIALKQERSGETYVPSHIRLRYGKSIANIVGEILADQLQRESGMAQKENALFNYLVALSSEEKTKTISSMKHEELMRNPNFRSYSQHIFVKTRSYDLVNAQQSYILVGRKGSGKSSLTYYMEKNNTHRFKERIAINVDRFNLALLFNLFTTPRWLSDLGTLSSMRTVLGTIWELFVYLCCVNVLVSEHRAGNLEEDQAKHMPEVTKYYSQNIREFIEEDGEKLYLLYSWCFARVVEIIERAPREAGKGDSYAAFTVAIGRLSDPTYILRSVVGAEVIAAVASVVELCKRRFLVSFDGFDTTFDEFRKRMLTEEKDVARKAAAIQFEIDWLASFLLSVESIRNGNSSMAKHWNALGSRIDFCVTVPSDRYLEVRQDIRDAVIFNNKQHELKWSGIELAIMLRKRLEVLGQHNSKRSGEPRQRLEELLVGKFNYIPMGITPRIGSAGAELPLFLYILRHTFWRPREILIYFSKIDSVLSNMKEARQEVRQAAVRKCISDATLDVVRWEFFGEFKRHFINLEHVVGRFRRVRQILLERDMKMLLQDAGLEVAGGNEGPLSIDETIWALIQIGFLGLRLGQDATENIRPVLKDFFWFNERDSAFETLRDRGYRNCHFVIHPAFCEYLDLDTSNQELSCSLSWQDLRRQEDQVVRVA